MGRIIVMGASAGGIDAMKVLFDGLPDDFTIPILAVLHIGGGIHGTIPSLFGRNRQERFLYAADKMEVEAGRIYLAPPNYHMLLEKTRRISLSVEPRVHYCRPSVDVLFESAAYAGGADVTGILLTGANEDGAAGLLRIKEYGGGTVVQDPDTAAMPVMPRAALNLFTPDLRASLPGILEKMLEIDKRELE